MPFLPFFTATVANPTNPNEVKAPEQVPYWSQPSTRWNVFTFSFPFLLAFGGFLLSLYLVQQAQGRDIEANKVQLQRFQPIHEERIAQMATIQSQMAQQNKDIAELRDNVKALREEMRADNEESQRDIKALLARSAH